MSKLKHIWVFSDSIKGHEVQSMALADSLSDNVSLFHCTIRQPWLSFAPKILPRFGRNIIWKNSKPDISKIPDIIITCGRTMAAIGKFYKRLLQTKHIQILNPGDNPKNYDLLICPEHDRLKGDNIIYSKGSLHKIDIEFLAKTKVTDPVDIVLFIGNPSKMFFNHLEETAFDINKFYPNTSLAVCGSRRTPKKYHNKIKHVFSEINKVWLTPKDGENPYLQLLSTSSIFIVTADSINMLSESCATNKQVIAIEKNSISPKHKRFIKSIESRLSEFGDENTNISPLKVLSMIKQQVLSKIVIK